MSTLIQQKPALTTPSQEPLSQPTLSGSLASVAISEFLTSMSQMNTPGWLEFKPSGIRLRLYQGHLVGASGTRFPLGSILVRRGVLTESQLEQAMAIKRRQAEGHVLLGTVLLLEPFNLSRAAILDALSAEITLTVHRLLIEPQERYGFFRADPPPVLHPKVNVAKALLTSFGVADEIAISSLPLDAMMRMVRNPIETTIDLSQDEWRLCSYLNGRRSLRSAMQLIASSLEDGTRRSHRAAQHLVEHRLIEFAPVMGLSSLILAKRKQAGANYHPPASLTANLFVKQIDGVRSARAIAGVLNLSPDRAAQIAVSLYRDQVIEVIEGQYELELLLEEY
jgi:hypothetical protein